MAAGWSWRLVVLAVALFFAAPAAAEETVFPARGGSGDMHYDDNCPVGEYMIGIKGGHGAWLDRIGIICMPMTSMGYLSGPVKYDRPEFGGGGGAGFSKRCKPHYFVGAYSAQNTEDGKRVQLFKIWCVSNDEATWPRYFLVAGSEAMPGDTVSHDCPPGQIGSGIHGRSGKDVNSLAVNCRTAVVPAKAAPPPPPVNPTAGNKPIKTTGKARVPAQPAPAQPLVTAVDDVDVYEGPDGGFNVIGMMAQGVQARQLGRQEGWCKLAGVAQGGGDGWVADDHLNGCK